MTLTTTFTTADWLHSTEIAAVATDTWGFEVRPNEFHHAFQPLHQVESLFASLDLADEVQVEPASEDSVECEGVGFIGIDSLNAYLQAMPGEQFLTLQMHELLSYLNQQGATTMMILGQHGLMAEGRTDVDLSYLSDNTVLLRFFEASGKVRRAISVIKSRTTQHASTIHELQLGEGGVRIGAPLQGFEGVLSGIPTYRGVTPMMAQAPHASE